MKKSVGEKLTDEEAENVIKENDVDNAQCYRTLTDPAERQGDSTGASSGTNCADADETIAGVQQERIQKRVQNRTVERIVDVPVPQIQEEIVQAIQLVVHERISDYMVEQIVKLYTAFPIE